MGLYSTFPPLSADGPVRGYLDTPILVEGFIPQSCCNCSSLSLPPVTMPSVAPRQKLRISIGWSWSALEVSWYTDPTVQIVAEHSPTASARFPARRILS